MKYTETRLFTFASRCFGIREAAFGPLLLLAGLIGFTSNGAEPVVLSEVDETDKRQCSVQMLRIRSGILSYLKDHKRLPDFLSDLLSTYARKSDFTCPTTRHVGDRGWTKERLLSLALRDPKSDDGTYSYEF